MFGYKIQRKPKVVNKIIKQEAPVSTTGFLDSIRTLIHYSDRKSGKDEERRLRAYERRQAPLNSLRESLRKSLEEEVKSFTDTDKIYVYHIDKKCRPILDDILGDNFIKHTIITLIPVNSNLALYDDVILIGIQKLEYDFR